MEKLEWNSEFLKSQREFAINGENHGRKWKNKGKTGGNE